MALANLIITIIMQKYSTLVFDLGNVLIPFHHDWWIKNFNKIENGLGDQFYTHVRNNLHVHTDYEKGEYTDEEFIKINLEWLDNKVSESDFIKIYSEIFTFNQNVIDLLPVLKENYSLILLSNTNSLHEKYGWGDYSFVKYFDYQILSHEIGVMKPNPGIYKAAEALSTNLSESHIFIDDVFENVEGAINIGWDGIHFTGYENLVEKFKLRNIL